MQLLSKVTPYIFIPQQTIMMKKFKQKAKNQLSSQNKDSEGDLKTSKRALDRVNLTLGDVRDVFEPYLAIFLTADRQWSPELVGIAISTTSIAGILTQTPAGAIVDASRDKRLLVAISTFAVGVSYLVIINFKSLFAVVASQAVIGISSVIVGPTIAAISLGLVGKQRLQKRVGRNEAFNHAGNACSAIVAGILGQFVGRIWVFYLLVILCIITVFSVFQIRNQDIDNVQARADDSENGGERANIKDLFRNRQLLVFASSVLIFYLASAALLPLVSQQLSGGKQDASSVYVSAAVVISQLIMIPVAAWAGKTADSWGRKPLLLVAFIAVILRAFLYTLSNNPLFLISMQVFEGIASGIFTVLLVIVVADLTQGTGRFNFAQGAINTMVGIGAALSNLGSGFLVKAAGYKVGFTALGIIAAIGLFWFWFAMPETKKSSS
ncbi:major facilitator superfamily protein [Calothrix sp. NIES-4071]|nr:major facilitator superfamily protein [Calothrix sp. NIES-4071]BAZ56352.1 major facilitator superfamily protein [Calothrix sp. NIES-4105]